MSTKTTKPTEANVGASERLPEAVGNTTQGSEAAERKLEKFPDPCVYCGPSVRGVARQFTVYRGGIPNVLENFLKEHPTAKRLLVSEERFAQVRARLETAGTVESILFQKLKAEL